MASENRSVHEHDILQFVPLVYRSSDSVEKISYSWQFFSTLSCVEARHKFVHLFQEKLGEYSSDTKISRRPFADISPDFIQKITSSKSCYHIRYRAYQADIIITFEAEIVLIQSNSWLCVEYALFVLQSFPNLSAR